MKNWIKALKIKAFGSGTYSQSYQDELIEIVFANIKPKNPTPYCVEFGFNSKRLTMGSGANVARLVLENKWDCLLLDGEHENIEINLHKHFLTSANISKIFRQHNVPEEPEYISIDLDSTDLWLFDAVVRDYRAMLFSVEYNSHYPLSAAITFPNDPKVKWEEDRGYGASLKALNMVAVKHGYSLLWVVPPFDAFFIRNDLIDDGSSQICFPFEKWEKQTQLICHVPLKDKSRAKIFIDYETYLNTNGDITKSNLKAYPICKKYLTASYSEEMRLKVKRIIPKGIKYILKKLIRKTPIYQVLMAVRKKQALLPWEREGKPIPPPHIVKQWTIRELAEKFGLKVLIETGTFYGDMVEAMKNHFSRIYSIELSNELYAKAKQRFAGDDRIKIIHGDSGIELRNVIVALDQPALFWLDGHYSDGVTAKCDKDTPIYEELAHIFNDQEREHVVIIDDARLFGTDPAYPSIDELTGFIKLKSPNAKIEVKNDSIRVFPLR